MAENARVTFLSVPDKMKKPPSVTVTASLTVPALAYHPLIWYPCNIEIHVLLKANFPHRLVAVDGGRGQDCIIVFNIVIYRFIIS